MALQKIEWAKPVEHPSAARPVSERFGLAVLCALTESLEAAVPVETETSPSKKVAVGSRPLSAEKRAEWEQQRQKKQPRIAQLGQIEWAPVEVISNDLRNHFLASYSVFDNTVELEDGSFWRIPSQDMHKVLSWALNDELMITPNKWLHSGYYSISNRTTGDSIGADLIVGPQEFGENTHWIIGIDRWLGRVYLENGTYWDVRGLDQNLLSDWEVNDTVILGDGANEWFGRHDSILINVNMNHYVFANQGA